MFRVLVFAVLVGCSEYRLRGTTEAPPVMVPPSDPAPGTDTGERDTGEPPEVLDCEPHRDVEYERLSDGLNGALTVFASDVDAKGRMLMSASQFNSSEDLFGVWPDGEFDVLAEDHEPYIHWPRVLANGRVLYGAYVDDIIGFGIYDLHLKRDVEFIPAPVQDWTAIEPAHDDKIFIAARDRDAGEHWLLEFDLNSGEQDLVVDLAQHGIQSIQDMAVTRTRDRVYIVTGTNHDRPQVNMISKIDATTWGSPTPVWSGDGSAPHWIPRIAVDACGSLYIHDHDQLLFLEGGSGPAEPIASLDTPAVIQDLFWGSGADDAPSDTLYGTGYVDDPWGLPGAMTGRFAIPLGVDGNHLLAR